MRNIFLLIFIFFSFSIAAQEKRSAQYIGWKGPGIRLHTIPGKKFSCTFMINNDSVKAFVLDNNSNIVQVFTVRRKKITEKFLGSFIRDGNIYLFLDNADSPGLHSWLFNIANRSIKENIVPFEIKKEKIISRLSSKNNFFYFTMNKKASEFVIYNFIDESHYDTLRYPVEPGMWDKIRNNLFHSSDRDIDKTKSLQNPDFNIENVDMEGECDVEIAKSPNKSYIHNDTLILLCNSTRSVTNVFEFDLANKKFTSRILQHAHNGLNEEPAVDNSFLLDNKLYYVSATTEALFIQVVDFYSGNILKEFSTKTGEEISFKNTPITQEGGGFFGITRELGKTKQLLRKMCNGSAVVTATRDIHSNQVQLLVGSYIEQSNGGGGSAFGPGGSVGFFPTGGFSRASWKKSARFKMLLNSDTNEHIAGEIPLSINEKIESYTKGINIPGDGENLFAKNGNYYYVYYDKEKREINIVKF